MRGVSNEACWDSVGFVNYNLAIYIHRSEKMTALPQFDYQNESIDELFKLIDDYDIESILCAFYQAIRPEPIDVDVSQLPEATRVICTVLAFQQGAACIGFGMEEFFGNSESGRFFPALAYSLKAINADPEVVELSELLMKQLGISEKSQYSDYLAMINRVECDFSDIGEELAWELQDLLTEEYEEEYLLELLMEYILANKQSIIQLHS